MSRRRVGRAAAAAAVRAMKGKRWPPGPDGTHPVLPERVLDLQLSADTISALDVFAERRGITREEAAHRLLLAALVTQPAGQRPGQRVKPPARRRSPGKGRKPGPPT